MEQHSAMRSTYQALSSTSSSSSSSALQQQQQHQQLLQQQQHHHHQQQQQQQQQHSTSGDSQPFARRLSDGSLAYYAQSLTFTLNKLKRIFTQEQLYHQGKQTATATGLDSGGSGGGGPDTRVAAFECLAELSKVMTILLERKNGKSALGRSKELLTSSMALVDAVKQYNYEAPYAADRQAAVLEAISKLYSAFHVSVSNYVMEDADEAAMAPALTSSTTSSSSSGAATAATAATQKQQQHLQQLQFHQQPKHPNQHHQHQQPQHKLSVPLIKSSKSSTDTSSSSTTMTADGHHHHSSQSSPSPQHRRSTVDPPTSLEVVHQSQQQQPLQPEDRLLFHPEGMNIALEQAKMWAKYAKDLVAYLEKRTAIEMEYNRSVMKNATNLKASIGEESFLPFQDVYLKFSSYEAENGHLSVNNFELLNTNFIVSLNEHRLEFEKKIKKIKESWTREKKAMTECQNNFNKCRDLYTSKQSELYKLQMAYKSSSEQQSNSNSDSWAVSNSSSNTSEKLEKKRRSLEEAKQREKEAYDNVNKSMMAVNSCRAHLDKAQRELILKTKDLLGMLEMKIKECSSHYFETLKDSMTYSPSQMDRIIEETGRYEFGRSYREHANSLPVTPYTSRAPVGGGGGIVTAPTGDFESSESDTNSPLGDAVGAQQLMGTATNMQHHRQQQQQLQQLHQYQLQFQHHHQQQQQHLQQHHHHQQHQQQQNSVKLSYDERFEHEINAITKEFKSCIDSMTTTTTTSSSTSGNHDHHHPFHRKKSRLFGLPLSSLTSGSGVPAIVRQCVEEIELNGAAINGIYRVSGVKSKVESLCASFEDAAEEDNNGGRCNLVDLSSLSPNIVANVLKHFFRELPEPLMTFHLYGEFMVLAKKFASTSAAGSEGAPGGGGGRHQHPDQHPPEVAEEIVGTFKRLLSRMSPAHYFTLRYLMRHLRRIARNAAVNNMPASNLGIIFGPTLLRRNNDPNATSSTLYDATHQGRVVELLILYANEVFSMTDDEEGEEGEEEEEEEEEEEDLEEEIEHQRKFNETIEQPRRSATTSTTSHKQQQQQLSSSMLLSSSLPFEESMKKSATLSAASSHQKSPNSQNSHRLLKSATCSSIGGLPSSASSSLTSSSLTANAQQQQSMINSSSHNAGPKANIVEARRQFFTSGAFHGHPGVGGGGGVGPGGSSNVFLSKFAASRTPFGFSPTHSSILGVPATSSVSAGNSHHHQQQQQYHHQNQQQQHYTHHQYNLLNNSYQHHHLNSMMAGGGVGGLSAGESAAGLSPFSQLAAGASGATKIKKLTSANYHQVAQQQQQQQQGGKIYPRNTELSKSSSSIYSMGNKAGGSGGGMSLITSNEDIV